MPQALRCPHVQLPFRLREIELGRGECEKPREEAGEVFEFPSKLSIFERGYVEELPCGGQEQEVSDDA